MSVLYMWPVSITTCVWSPKIFNFTRSVSAVVVYGCVYVTKACCLFLKYTVWSTEVIITQLTDFICFIIAPSPSFLYSLNLNPPAHFGIKVQHYAFTFNLYKQLIVMHNGTRQVWKQACRLWVMLIEFEDEVSPRQIVCDFILYYNYSC